MSSIEALQSIASEISKGFEILLDRLETQRRVEQDLRQQLARAIERFNSNTSDNPSDGELSAWQDEIVKQISQDSTFGRVRDHTTLPEVETAKKAVARLRSNMSTPNIARCPVAHHEPELTEEMEKDFTVPGRPSNLECPFVTTSRSTPLKSLDQRDPIAAEFHHETLSAQSVDEAKACGRCPIRFLDKHSPEEIAQYFENHKHEIPRSHEICVKRYQQNENSIRKLDAKYGNLVSMIQGLGDKHKQYLPNEQHETRDLTEIRSDMVVEKWAYRVSESPDQDPAEVPFEQRQSHFEKPLRDIRVGESPTRPWGISVPVDRPVAPSAAPSQQASQTPSQKQKVEAETKKDVPHKSSLADSNASTSQSRTPSRKGKRSRSSKITINGPVFFGYSAEQTALFLQQIGFANQA